MNSNPPEPLAKIKSLFPKLLWPRYSIIVTEVTNMVHHYKHYSQFNWLQKYLQIGYLSNKKVQELSNRLSCSSMAQHLSRMYKAMGSIIKNTRKKLSCDPAIPFWGRCSQKICNQDLKEIFLPLCIINTIHRDISHDCQKGNQAKHTSTDEWTVCTKQKKNNRTTQLRNTMNIANVRLLLTQTVLQKQKQKFYMPEAHTKILIKDIVG